MQTNSLEDLKLYLFDIYGLSEKEMKDINDFKSKFIALFSKFDGLKNKNTAKEIVDLGNVVPTYSSLAIMRFAAFENKDLLARIIPDCIDFYNKMKKDDPESTGTKDLAETIVNLIFFCPEYIVRRFFKERYDIMIDFIKSVNNRYLVFPLVMNTVTELFIGSKDEKFIKDILELFNIVTSKINECDNILPEAKSVMPLTLKECRVLMKQYLDTQGKKNSLSQLKIIITRKFEFGQIFHHFITLCPFSGEVINSDLFPESLIKDAIIQMKLFQVIEIYSTLKDVLSPNKLAIIKEFLSSAHGVDADSTNSKLIELIKKIPEEKYGILGRQINLMPTETEETVLGCLKEMMSKLSTVANNLTVILSEKSLSLTICAMSRNGLYSEFDSQFNKIEEGSTLAKMKDKDVMRKIKESNAGSLTLDQMSIAKTISVLHSMIKILSQNEKIEKEDLFTKSFEYTIKELKCMMSKRFYNKIFNILYGKCRVTNS